MLDDAKRTGVTIMRLDEEMDHGPIVAQQEITVEEWPIYEDFEEMMARKGAQLLARILPDWVAGKIAEKEQDHSKATYTKKITKEDGLIDPADIASNAPQEKAYAAFRKIQAFHEWPQAYFFIERDGKKIRVKVTKASFNNDRLVLERVLPEGKKEMPYEDFARGYLKNK
jgi:methionyl-tRNA formyltransferase